MNFIEGMLWVKYREITNILNWKYFLFSWTTFWNTNFFDLIFGTNFFENRVKYSEQPFWTNILSNFFESFQSFYIFFWKPFWIGFFGTFFVGVLEQLLLCYFFLWRAILIKKKNFWTTFSLNNFFPGCGRW